MDNIKNLSKAELSKYNEQLVLDLLQIQGFEISKVIAGRVRTKYRISQSCDIKITGYRYNEKVNGNYAYVLKKDFNIDNEKYLFFVLYLSNQAHILKIPVAKFKNIECGSPFKNRDYIGLKSLPEYGIEMNKKNIIELLMYEEK